MSTQRTRTLSKTVPQAGQESGRTIRTGQESGRILRTYLVNNAGHSFARLMGYVSHVAGRKKNVIRRIGQCAVAREQLREAFDVEWHDRRILDVGCGQLQPNALIFGVDNTVVAVDMDLAFRIPYIFDLVRTIYQSGITRAVTTLGRQLLGVDRRFRNTLARYLGVSRLPQIETHRMNATRLRFADDSFDGVYSFSVLQHIDKPDEAVKEMCRVLKPGAVAYIQVHLYTSIAGSDHPLTRSSSDKYPPWAHLRPSTPYYQKHGLYVNCWRLKQYKELFESVFDEVRYVTIDEELRRAQDHLTPSIWAQLADYSEEELLTTTLTVLCKTATMSPHPFRARRSVRRQPVSV